MSKSMVQNGLLRLRPETSSLVGSSRVCMDDLLVFLSSYPRYDVGGKVELHARQSLT